MKVTRDAFLYLNPKPPPHRFAQCGTCRMFLPTRRLCAVIGVKVVPGASCGLYVHGTPTEAQPVAKSVSGKEAGLVDRQVRCENCTFFRPQEKHCHLFHELNEILPDIFDLDVQVDAHGCCNAQIPRA